MWNTGPLGVGAWKDEHGSWLIDARGGDQGVGIVDRSQPAPEDEVPAEMAVRLAAVDQPTLPTVGESFVRGDQWHLTYPQGKGLYELRLVMRPVESADNRLVLETTIAIQTDLLDTHPKIDLLAACQERISHPLPTASDAPDKKPGAAPIHLALNAHGSVAVLLGPHDAPFTSDISGSEALKLRLFGEFLEKGVIRRARPWLVIDQSGQVTSEDRLVALWRQLCGSPVPLT